MSYEGRVCGGHLFPFAELKRERAKQTTSSVCLTSTVCLLLCSSTFFLQLLLKKKFYKELIQRTRMTGQLFLLEWSVAPSCGNAVTRLCFCESASATEPDFKSKDWVFLNYTYKRFEGLTQRGTIPTYMKAGKA